MNERVLEETKNQFSQRGQIGATATDQCSSMPQREPAKWQLKRTIEGLQQNGLESVRRAEQLQALYACLPETLAALADEGLHELLRLAAAMERNRIR